MRRIAISSLLALAAAAAPAWSQEGAVAVEHVAEATTTRTFKLENGKSFEAEGQEIKEYGQEIDDAMTRYGLEKRPDYLVIADQHGNQWVLYKPENRPESLPTNNPFVGVLAENGVVGPEAAPLVHEKFIVGKAFWIWWPPGRWFDLIK